MTNIDDPMKKALRMIALIVVLGAIGFWVATGTNRGWTKTRVPVKTMDEVTGIEGITYEKRLVPGLDFLGTSILLAAIFTGVSFFIRTKSNHLAPEKNYED